MYKYANDMLPPVLNELFIVNSTIHDHNTRQKNLIHTNRGHIFPIDLLIMLVHVYGTLY